MNIAYIGVAIMFLTMGYSFYNKAGKLPRTNEAEIKEFKKTKNTGISFMLSGLMFAILAIIKHFD